MAFSLVFLIIIGAALIGVAMLVTLIVVLVSRGSQRHPRLVGCPHCGRNLLPESTTCPNCGESIRS